MNGSKIWVSMLIDFVITAGTAFLAYPHDMTMSGRAIATIAVGAAVSVAKGSQTYWATHPRKRETENEDVH